VARSSAPAVREGSGPSGESTSGLLCAPDRSTYTPAPVKIKILCTLGPASLRPDVLRGMEERGVDLYRINLSHTTLEQVEPAIELIRGASSVPISLDSQGAQVRCGLVRDDVLLEAGGRIELTAEPALGDAERLNLWPPVVFETLSPGARVGVDFDGVRLEVDRVEEGRAWAEVVSGGRVRSNKAVTIDPAPALPALSDKDETAIAIGARLGVTHYALSFATHASHVDRIRGLAPPGAHIMAKLESREGIRNMDGVIEAADSIIIDRGDLSHEVPFETVPYYQKAIVRRANRGNRPIYVATNLLESLVTNQTPTIAEANDIANTLLDGVHGLVLAAETAIGVDPLGSIDLVAKAIRAFEHASEAGLVLGDPAPDRVG
jgi:sulfate adenylyltransferase